MFVYHAHMPQNLQRLYSDRDEAILCVIYKTISLHPSNSKYQQINIKNLSKILRNPDLSLEIMRNFGFIDTSNNSYLVFNGLESTTTTALIIDIMFGKGIFTHKLYNTALFTCWTQKNTEIDDNSTNYYRNSSFDLPLVSDVLNKVYGESTTDSQFATWMIFLREYNQLPNDLKMDTWVWIARPEINKYNKNVEKRILYVLNNNGVDCHRIDWDKKDLNKMICDFVDKWSHIFYEDFPKYIKNRISLYIERGKSTFVKKCLYFTNEFIARNLLTFISKTTVKSLNSIEERSLHQDKHFFLSQIEKYRKLFDGDGMPIVNIDTICRNAFKEVFETNQQSIYWTMCESRIESYIKNVVESSKNRLKKAKEICKRLHKTKLANSNDNSHTWKCLLCNRFNKYHEFERFCPTCDNNDDNKTQCKMQCETHQRLGTQKCASMNPLFFVKRNRSITFGVNKSFYIIMIDYTSSEMQMLGTLNKQRADNFKRGFLRMCQRFVSDM